VIAGYEQVPLVSYKELGRKLQAERAERPLVHSLPLSSLYIFTQIVESETSTGWDQKGRHKVI